MKRMFRLSFILAILALSAMVALGGLCGDALAYKRKSGVTGPGGNTATQEVTATKSGKGYSRSSTTTGPKDNSVQTQSQGSYDSTTNTWTKDKSVTGPKGKSKSWEKSTTVTK
jgi:hypothetical protein